MKYIKLFEDHSIIKNSHARKILSELNRDIEVEEYRKKYTETANVYYNEYNNPDGNKHWLNIELKGKSQFYISISIYTGGEEGDMLEIFKSGRVTIDRNNIENIVDIIEKSKHYMGGLHIDGIRNHLYKLLSTEDRVSEKISL